MPRNVRNFFVDLEVDGRSSSVATGPRNRKGGFSMVISMRSDGGIVTPLDIVGQANEDGELFLFVRDGQTKKIIKAVKTRR